MKFSSVLGKIKTIDLRRQISWKKLFSEEDFINFNSSVNECRMFLIKKRLFSPLTLGIFFLLIPAQILIHRKNNLYLLNYTPNSSRWRFFHCTPVGLTVTIIRMLATRVYVRAHHGKQVKNSVLF